jgi:hypothetical protein
MHVEARVDGVGEHRRGVEPSREEQDGVGHGRKLVTQ